MEARDHFSIPKKVGYFMKICLHEVFLSQCGKTGMNLMAFLMADFTNLVLELIRYICLNKVTKSDHVHHEHS